MKQVIKSLYPVNKQRKILFWGKIGGSVVVICSIIKAISDAQIAVSILSFVALCINLYIIWLDRDKPDPKIHHYNAKNWADINIFMKEWIITDGYVMLFSRDLSFIEKDDNLKSLCVDKAKNKEIGICVQKKSSFLDELKQTGADVYEYGDSFTPYTRFTIVGYKKGTSSLAIGHTSGAGNNKTHIIKEYDEDTDSEVANLAKDMVRLIVEELSIKKG